MYNFLTDLSLSYRFSILIRDVIKGETVRSVEICKGRAIVKSIDRRHIRRSNIEDRVFNASVIFTYLLKRSKPPNLPGGNLPLHENEKVTSSTVDNSMVKATYAWVKKKSLIL